MTNKAATRMKLLIAVGAGIVLFAVAYGATRFLATTSSDQRSQAAGQAETFNCANGTSQECPANQGYKCVNKVCVKGQVTLGSCSSVCPAGTVGLCKCPSNCSVIDTSAGKSCGNIFPTNVPQKKSPQTKSAPSRK